MKACISRTSNWDYEEVREMDTLEELRDFIANCGYNVVVGVPKIEGAEYNADIFIEIYDDYRE